MSTTFRVSILALLLAAGNSLVFADDGNGQPATPAKPETLKGPSVPERKVPGVENGLGTMERGNDKKGAAREQPIPHREFMRMLDDALGASAPENIRMTADQRTQVEKISEEFTQKQRAYIQTNRDEVEKLVQKYGPEVRQLAMRMANERGGPGGGGADAKKGPRDGKKQGDAPAGDKPTGDKPADPMQDKPAGLTDDQRAEVIAKLKEIHAGAPKVEDTRTAIWGLLKPDQQAAVQVKVDAFKAQREKQMDERYKEREKKKLEERGTKKNPAEPGAGGTGGAGGAGAPGKQGDAPKPLDPVKRDEVLKALPDDLKAQVTKMRPEMQDRILARVAEVPEGKAREELYARLRERLKNAGEGDRPAKNKK